MLPPWKQRGWGPLPPAPEDQGFAMTGLISFFETIVSHMEFKIVL